MIYHKLFITEQRVKNVLREHKVKLETIDRIKEFMERVDDRVEFISVSSSEDLERVISELKGDRLSEVEKKMVEEIFNADRSGYESEKIKN